MTTPTARTLKYLRDNGWPLVQVVEVYNPFSRKRNDLFGFADVLAVHPDRGHLYVQVTSGSHVNNRLEKLRENFGNQIADIISAGGRVEIHGWRKILVCSRCGEPKRGGNCECDTKGAQRWRPIIVDVDMEMLVYGRTRGN